MPDALTPRQCTLITALAFGLTVWARAFGVTIPELFGLIDFAKTRISDATRG